MTGLFVLSLDFELLWGVRDHATRETYGANVLGGREAIPKILELFAQSNIRATWATIGFLFCESKDELLASLPESRPSYGNGSLSNYIYLDEVGSDEKSDPFYYGMSLVNRISQTPGQEIGTHTLSHYYCREEGQELASFAADLSAALKLGEARKITQTSIVFPRNQFTPQHLEVCSRLGISAYRGNPGGWAYEATRSFEQTPLRRAARLVDAYTGVLGKHTFRSEEASPINVPASRFLRPCSGQLARFHSRHVATICHGMTAAAKAGHGFHLWWHPHNFGVATKDNLDGLRQIIAHFKQLEAEFGMTSASMGDLA